jgi:hypothetical protein
MEIGFFFGGMTRTASPQFQSSLQSGSFLIWASISSSVVRRSRSRSLLILRGVSRKLAVVFLSFIASCSPRRHDPADVAADRTHIHNFYIGQETEHHVADFAITIRTFRDYRSREDMPRIVEVDASLSKSPGAFFLIAVEGCDKNIPRGFAMTGSKSYTACYPAL